MRNNVSIHTRLLYAIPLICITSCTFVGTPYTNDYWELINTAQWRQERNRSIGARNVLTKALPLATEHDDNYALAVIHNDLGLTYIRENKNTVEAENHYKIAREISTNFGYPYELAYNYLLYAELWELSNVHENACVSADKARELIENIITQKGKPPFKQSMGNALKLKEKIIKYAEEIQCETEVNHLTSH